MTSHPLLRIACCCSRRCRWAVVPAMYFKDAGAPPAPNRATRPTGRTANTGPASCSTAPRSGSRASRWRRPPMRRGRYDIDSEAVFALRFPASRRSSCSRPATACTPTSRSPVSTTTSTWTATASSSRHGHRHTVTTTVRLRDTEEQREFTATGPVVPGQRPAAVPGAGTDSRSGASSATRCSTASCSRSPRPASGSRLRNQRAVRRPGLQGLDAAARPHHPDLDQPRRQTGAGAGAQRRADLGARGRTNARAAT